MAEFKYKSTEEIYKAHLKRVFDEEGFFPEDFKEALKGMYVAMEEYR